MVVLARTDVRRSSGRARAGGEFDLLLEDGYSGAYAKWWCRIAGRSCPRPASQEPCMRLSTHTAQASTKASFDTRLHSFLCCLHNTRLQPPYMALDNGPVDAVPRHAERCTRSWCCVHLLSSRLEGSTNSLVKRDREDVCPLSRGMMLQPLSASLQDGVRFFLNPVPAAP